MEEFDGIYRESTLGKALEDTLREMEEAGRVNSGLMIKVLEQFDKSMAIILPEITKSQLVLSNGTCASFNIREDRSIFQLKNVVVTECGEEVTSAEKISLIAVPSKKALEERRKKTRGRKRTKQ
ncbi:transcription initiation factor IIA subunit 2-like [Teleopsis dalmanni]|uniref:transcription initiation factor IIA subunit 2-like n=1 Tax=Teleopsis dalmanni TaxID=139649 RepID=UPI000D329FC0|nr:transcription initiation factor IIA subunit 2-like [Teleopsis dalmanni]